MLIQYGGMAEWSKAAVLKTVEVHASVGSNPTPSANTIAAQYLGEMAELAEGARLLSEYGGYTPSWVRIPFSPPFKRIRADPRFLGSAFFLDRLRMKFLQSLFRIVQI